MPRRKTDFAKLMEKANALLEKHNVDTSDIVVPDGPVTNYRNEDAVVVFVNHPPHFMPGICKNCKRPFAANKKSVGFCSDLCRKEEWRRTMHVPWASVSTRDVWDGDPPLIVTPDQLETLEKLTRWFTQNQKSLEIQPLEPIEYTSRPKETPTLQEFVLGEIDKHSRSLDEEQTDRNGVSPRTSYPASQSQSDHAQTQEEEPVFDFD